VSENQTTKSGLHCVYDRCQGPPNGPMSECNPGCSFTMSANYPNLSKATAGWGPPPPTPAIVHSSFMEEILGRMPRGLSAQTLLAVMIESGFSEDEASKAIRRSLDRGTIRLGRNLNLEVCR
jgi:hypothetical protein